MSRTLRMRSLVAVVVTIAGLTCALNAQTTFENLLVPVIALSPLPGANGSMWSTSLLVRNTSAVPVQLSGVFQDCNGFSGCPPPDLLPEATYEILPAVNLGNPATILAVPTGRSGDLVFTLRVQDLSRQSQTWGTTIPVVGETKFHSDAVWLLDLPISTSFRNTLRIYEIDGRSPAQVVVRVFAIAPAHPIWLKAASPDRLLGEATVTLRPGSRNITPGYAEIADLSKIASLIGVSRVAIQVQPLTPGLRIWSFASVTNNETQHVTVITPQ